MRFAIYLQFSTIWVYKSIQKHAIIAKNFKKKTTPHPFRIQGLLQVIFQNFHLHELLKWLIMVFEFHLNLSQQLLQHENFFKMTSKSQKQKMRKRPIRVMIAKTWTLSKSLLLEEWVVTITYRKLLKETTIVCSIANESLMRLLLLSIL